MTTHEASARAAKAIALLDILAAHVTEPLRGDAVRLLTDEAWQRAERAAGVRPSSSETRELVAHLADSRAVIRDPFVGLTWCQPKETAMTTRDEERGAYWRKMALAPRRPKPEDTCEGYGPAPRTPDRYMPAGYGYATCSMCGRSDHTERERTDDGEWDEDCVFHPFFDGDGNDLRRPGQAGRAR